SQHGRDRLPSSSGYRKPAQVRRHLSVPSPSFSKIPSKIPSFLSDHSPVKPAAQVSRLKPPRNLVEPVLLSLCPSRSYPACRSLRKADLLFPLHRSPLQSRLGSSGC